MMFDSFGIIEVETRLNNRAKRKHYHLSACVKIRAEKLFRKNTKTK